MSSWDIFIKSFITDGSYKEVLKGLGNTAAIAVVGLVIGIAVGTILAVSKVIDRRHVLTKIWSGATDVYLWLFRGTPMIVQLLICNYVLFPALNISVNNLVIAFVAFGLNSGAYVCEIMRSGILSVDKGQMEASRSLGLSYSTSMIRVVIPQAVKNILPTLGNEFITLIKETSVVSFISIVDLTKAFRSIGTANYESIIPYLMLAVCYLLIVSLITIAVKLLEKRYRKNER